MGPVYHVVQMGWDGQVGLPDLGVLHGTSHGIPVYHMVQMGWDGQVGLDYLA